MGSRPVVLVDAGSKFILHKIGFTTAGVAAESLAAAYQASIGNVAANSLFASLQSMGALGTGVLGSALVPVAIIGGTVGGGYVIYKYNEEIS